MRSTIVTMSLLAASALLAGDAYEERIGADFVEKTVFRFRTKFNRLFVDTDEFKTLISHKVDVPPLLDGTLEDPCWKVADHSKSAFVQWLGKQPSRKQTVIYACHDDQRLYLAIVCEEPFPKALRMLSSHPGGQRSWGTAGRGDSIETFIESGGVGGTGRVFQFIHNIYPQIRYDGLYPPYVPWIGTGYRLQGAIGAKRWICELAFPHKGFNTDRTDRVDYRYEGPPRRGEVWGLRVVRNGPKPEHGEERMRSTWTFNPTTSWHVPYPTGIIVFEHRNALHNGKMNAVDPNTGRPLHWKFDKTSGRVNGDLVFDGKAGLALLTSRNKVEGHGLLITQEVGVLPNVGYRLTAKMKKLGGDATMMVGVDRPLNQYEFRKVGEWEKLEVDFFAEPTQREATVFLRLLNGAGSAAVDEIIFEQQIYGAPAGAVCLTGNSPRVDLNVGKKELEKVRYTYLEPGTDKEQFPYRKRWGSGWIHGHPDPAGTTGWIPVGNGSLTSPALQRHMIMWSHARPTAGYRPYPKGHEILFDLGKEYYVRTVEFLPSATISNMTVHVRPEGSDEYILTRKLRGAGVLNPPGPVLYGRLHRVNSVTRYVKLWFGDGGHGVYFVRIWAQEKGERTGISRFRWKEGLVVPEKKYRQFRKLESPVLMPAPQEVKWGNGEFVVQDDAPVYYWPAGRGETTAKHFASEVAGTFGIRLKLIPESGGERPETGRGAIVLGESHVSGLAARLAEAKGWRLDSERPGSQGYFLSSSADGILVCGYDQAGTFYGVQTLLQLLVRKTWQTAGAKHVEIRDWPYIPWRMIDCRNGVTPAFLRACARMKANVIKGSVGRYEKLADELFFLALAGGPRGGPIEMDDDENWYFLGRGKKGYSRINNCPSHHMRYENFERSGMGSAAGNTIDALNLVLDEMDHTGGGARWNADRRCLHRQMGGGDLFTEMICRAYDLFRLHNRKTAFLDTMMMPATEGGNGSYHNMYRAYDRVPEDIHVYCWRGIIGQHSSNPEEAIRRFERTTMLQGAMPFSGRGRINEFYKAPPGRRVAGVWNTVWGAAGPPDQVLAGQFCRSMVSVDGGCIVPFMTQAWNPNVPEVHTEDWVFRIGHLQQRVGEIALERELPSWRDGVEKEFFKVDLRSACNWSHIDPVPGDGKDWLDWGPNNDLRHLPRGDQKFEEIEFHVIDPATNSGKSIIMVASQPKNARLRVPNDSAEIPVGRTAASLVFLRTNLGGGHLPGYRISYEGVGPQGRGRYLTVPLDAMGNQSRRYSCYGVYPPANTSGAPDNPLASYRSAKHRMAEYFSIFFRLGWLGVTGAGDPLKLTVHEWVNPYPELAIESVSIHCPPGRSSGRLEALLAVTGVVPAPRDFELWRDRKRLPLVPCNDVAIEPSDVPVIPEDGKWPEADGETSPTTWLDGDGNEVCTVTPKGIGPYKTVFRRLDNAALDSGSIIRLAHAQVCRKLALRGQFYWEYHGPKIHYGVTRFRRLDYVVGVSADGTRWEPVAARKGICGEDGAHVHRLPERPIQYIRIQIDGKSYADERTGHRASVGTGLTWLQLYR